MLNLGLSNYFSIVLFLMVISLDIREFNVIISNKRVDMIIMCKLSFKISTIGCTISSGFLYYQNKIYIMKNMFHSLSNISILLSHIKGFTHKGLFMATRNSYRLGACFEQSDDYENVPYLSEKVSAIQIHSTLSKIRNKLVAHNTTKISKGFEIGKKFLILCCNDENIKQLLYFCGTKVFKNMSKCTLILPAGK